MNNLLRLDRRYTVILNRMAYNPFCRNFFRTASVAGDMYLWVACIVLFPFIFGLQGIINSITAVMALPISVGLQTTIKHTVKRDRPFLSMPSLISKFVYILDKHSFPSGHCLHAMMFTVLLSYNLPYVVYALFLLSAAVFLSRPVLGIHYVSDVLVGVVIGAIISGISIVFLQPLAIEFYDFVQTTEHFSQITNNIQIMISKAT